MAGTFSIYKYCKTNSGWRYRKAAFHSNGKIKPNVVIVSGVEEKHIEGRYFLNFNGQWIDAGVDALEAQQRRQLRLNQIEYERLSRKSSVTATAGRPSVIEFRGPKVIKDEVEAYLADATSREGHLAMHFDSCGLPVLCLKLIGVHFLREFSD